MNVGLLVLYSLPVVIVVFFVRAFFRMSNPKASGSDVWFHLHASEEIRRSRHRMPRTLSGFLIETPFDYPPLVHYLLSFTSRQRREKLEPFFGTIVDIAQTIAVYLFAFYLAGRYEVAFVAGMMFAFFPLLVKVDTRVYFLSPRPFGELFASLGLIFTLIFLWFGDIPLIFLAMFFLSFVFLSSKFGAQAVTIIYLLLALLLVNAFPLLILFGGIAIAFVISKGHYLKVLSGHIRHSSFYRSTIVHKHSWTKRISQKSIEHTTEEVGPRSVIVSLLRNPVIFAISHSPLIVILAVLLILDYGIIINDTYNVSLLAWVVASFIPVLLVSLKSLRFLGEAERYLEYGTIPLCALVTIVLFELNNAALWLLLFLAFLYSIVLIWVNYRVSVREFVIRPGDPMDSFDLFQRLNQLPLGRVLCIPVTTSFSVAYTSPHETLFWGGNVPSEAFTSGDFDFIFRDEFPFPSGDLDSLVQRYGITHILVWKQSLDRVPEGYYSGLSKYPMMFENSSYSIHRTGPQTTRA